MKRRKFLVTALFLGPGVLLTSTQRLQAQSAQGMQKFEQLSKDLNLTPQQKVQLIPILEAEAPKVKMIKSDTSLSMMQKMEQLKAVHDRTDPQVKSILTSEQYQKLQAMRKAEVQETIRKPPWPGLPENLKLQAKTCGLSLSGCLRSVEWNIPPRIPEISSRGPRIFALLRYDSAKTSSLHQARNFSLTELFSSLTDW
jgi:hypothetical protein